MKSKKDQQNNLWNIYNKQQKYNKKVLALYLLILSRIKKRLAKHKVLKFKGYEDNDRLEFDIVHMLWEQAKILINYLADHLKDTFIKTWKTTNENIEENTPLPNQSEIYKTTHMVWVGAFNFEQRQYRNTAKIIGCITKVLRDNDYSIEQKEALIDKYLKQYYNMNRRLVRTETMHTINSTNIECMRRGGVIEVMWVTCEDERTCKVCRPRDLEIYPIDMCPECPDHPNCRCILIAIRKLGGNHVRTIKKTGDSRTRTTRNIKSI